MRLDHTIKQTRIGAEILFSIHVHYGAILLTLSVNLHLGRVLPVLT